MGKKNVAIAVRKKSNSFQGRSKQQQRVKGEIRFKANQRVTHDCINTSARQYKREGRRKLVSCESPGKSHAQEIGRNLKGARGKKVHKSVVARNVHRAHVK